MNSTNVCLLAAHATAVSRAPVATAVALRCARFGVAPAAFRLSPSRRNYATHHQTSSSSSSSSSRRRSVTPFNDDGHVNWSDLSAAEKTGRAAQQSFNFGLIIVGVVLTGGVGYFLFTDVFSPNSKVANFNHAFDRLREDRRCTDLLGDPHHIKAYGDETANSWRRARPIASTLRMDAQGNEHLLINFHVEGPRATGKVYIHMVRPAGRGGDFVYRYFYMDVPGHDRVYLERSERSDHVVGAAGDKKTTLFGIKWS